MTMLRDILSHEAVPGGRSNPRLVEVEFSEHEIQVLRFMLDRSGVLPRSGMLSLAADATGLCILFDPSRDQSSGLLIPQQGGFGYHRAIRSMSHSPMTLKGALVAGSDLEPGPGCYLYSHGSIGLLDGMYPPPQARHGILQIYSKLDDTHILRVLVPLRYPSHVGVDDPVDIPVRVGIDDADQQGLFAQTFPVHLATAGAGGVYSGAVVHNRIYCEKTGPVNTLDYYIHTQGSGIDHAFLMVYDSDHALLGATADLTTDWETPGEQSASLAADVHLVADRYYFFSTLYQGASVTTDPLFLSHVAAPMLNAVLPASEKRATVVAGSETSPPASTASGSAITQASWIGARWVAP